MLIAFATGMSADLPAPTTPLVDLLPVAAAVVFIWWLWRARSGFIPRPTAAIPAAPETDLPGNTTVSLWWATWTGEVEPLDLVPAGGGDQLGERALVQPADRAERRPGHVLFECGPARATERLAGGQRRC